MCLVNERAMKEIFLVQKKQVTLYVVSIEKDEATKNKVEDTPNLSLVRRNITSPKALSLKS